jgi:hypothetical protein
MKIQYVTGAVLVAVFLTACGPSEPPQPMATRELSEPPQPTATRELSRPTQPTPTLEATRESSEAEPPTPTPTPDPSAQHIVVETSGVVELNRRSWDVNHYEPLQFGTIVRWGDLLRTASDSEATIVCADLEMAKVSSDFMAALPCPQSPPLLVYKGELVTVVRSTDVPQVPFIIVPRKTKLLDDRPPLRWNGVEGATSYDVTLLGDGNTVWQKKQVIGTEMAYPADEEPLQPGLGYILLVEADNGAKSEDEKAKGLGFTLLELAEAEAVRAEAQRLKDLHLSPEAEAYALAQLYANPVHGLLAEAIDLLEGLTAQGCRESAIYRSLGEWYYAIGLVRLAEERFRQAEALAGDLESRSAAQAGLGEVYASLGNTDEAKKWFEQAQAGYEELGHSSRVKEIEQRIADLS